MTRQILRFLGAFALLTVAYAQQLPEPKTGLSIERLYDFPIINGRSPAGAKMSPDGTRIVFGWNRTGERRRDVWVMDFPNGTSKMILEAGGIERPYRQDDERKDLEKEEEILYDSGITSFQWSPDSKEIMTSSYRGRVWLMDADGGNIRPLFDTNEQVSSANYSPDGKYIGFVRRDNVFRYDRQTGHVKQLTFISKSDTTIGGFYWSPDSEHIAVDWSDTSKRGKHVMMDFSKDRAEVVNITRMWHGEKSNDAQTGIVPTDGGEIKWVEGIPRYHWKVAEEWSPDSRMYAIGWISDDFQKYTITVVPIATMKQHHLYEEEAPKNYIPDFRKIAWTRDSDHILFTTDIIDGEFANRSLMMVEPNGKNLEAVYAEDHDIAAFMRPKDSDRIVLVTQARSPLKTEITILEPDGSRTVHVPMQDGVGTRVRFDDCAPPLVSDDGTRIATMASSVTKPWELYSVEPSIKKLTHSPLPEFDKVTWADYEQVTFDGPDGETLYGLLVTPKNFDDKRKHPAFLSNMYANSAKMAWKGYFSNYAAEELGMVSLFVDFAASWGQGGERNSGYYKSMGVIDTQEAVAAKDYLTSLGYINEERVGVWGTSYGGFLTNMIMLTAPGVFDTGVAVAPVTDWFSYNEWYTRRRLGMQEDDEEVYKTTSPVHHAAGLEGNLLLIHGILDDNVLFQDTVRLMQSLINEGKYFDLMAYPRDDHGINKATSRPHLYATIMRYLYWKLNRD
ncbi:MAG: S9 family peptidase [Armatimonadetes bacterium]|nr:S9 family peptidase [Armatimonadota bacterium]